MTAARPVGACGTTTPWAFLERPLYASVEQAVHEALRDRHAPAFDPNTTHGRGDGRELAMVARGYVLQAVDAVEVECRIAFVLFVRHGSVERVARMLRRRREVIDARVVAARGELQAVLAAKGLVPR